MSKVNKKALKNVVETLNSINMDDMWRQIQERLVWEGRCRCKDCERIRKAGGIPYDGIVER